jgi:ubiquinone/menaquinone biosynthesis C-methylase UbiE
LELINRESKQHNIANITTIWSDLEILNATKIANDSVDASFLINSIHQSKKPLNILREAIRITKKGGKIILIEWSGLASPLGPETANRIDKNKLVDVSKKNGLYLESEFAAGQYHFGLVLIKV